MSEATRAPALSDVLLELATETDMTVDDIREAVSDHPEFEAEIYAFAVDWHAMPETATPTDEASHVAARTPLEAATSPSNPFAGKTPPQLKEIAAQCDIPLSILSKLSNRLIDAATVPLLLVRRLAELLSVSPAAILAHLDREQTLATAADFRSSRPPEVGNKVSFADAVQGATMPREQREKWLELVR